MSFSFNMKNQYKMLTSKNIKCFFMLLLTASIARSNEESSAKSDTIETSIQPSFVSLVDPYIMSARGRWFFFGTGKRPYGMVNVFPDTSNEGQAGGGYNWKFNEVLGFCHLHGWMTVGLDVMPTTQGNYELTKEKWKSPFSRTNEIVEPGYHKTHLDKYNLDVEITSTERVGFHRYTSPEGGRLDIVTSLGGPSGSAIMRNGSITQVSANKLEGYYDRTDGRWNGPPRIRTFFVIEYDREFQKFSNWTNDDYLEPNKGKSNKGSGKFNDQSGVVVFENLEKNAQLQMKVALSFTSIENARLNLETECPGWDFNQIKSESQTAWNNVFGRIQVKGGSAKQQTKFYTDLWHVLMGRHKLNDVNGAIPDYTNGKGGNTDKLKVRQLPINEDGTSKHNYYNADSFWLTNFNLNLLWGLAYPDVLEDFALSFLKLDEIGGNLPRGPNGGGYSYIMTGSPATLLIASAHNLGVLDYPSEKVLSTLYRNHQPGGVMDKKFGDLQFYIDNGYCPMWDTTDRFDMAAGLTLEWAHSDWAAGQVALKINDTEKYEHFSARAKNYVNQWDAESGFMRPKRRDGSWYDKFDPMKWYGFVEGNAHTFNWYVPHDVKGLAKLMGGNDIFAERLVNMLEAEKPYDFHRGHKGHFSYGNQPSCHLAHLFNHVDKPWLSQYWVRQVSDIAFGGTDPHSGYAGEEDQGQMGAVSALMKIGLFSVRGAADAEPFYEITAPIFDEVTIKLNQDYYEGKEFKIITHHNSDKNCYIQKATLNGKPHNSCFLKASSFQAGGVLELWLGPEPNKQWGIDHSHLTEKSN